MNKITGIYGQKTSSKKMEEMWVKLDSMLKSSQREEKSIKKIKEKFE